MIERYKSISSNYGEKIIFFLLIGYTLSIFSSSSIHNVFAGLVTLGCLITIGKNIKSLLKEPIFIIFLAIIITQVISWILSGNILGDMADTNPKVDKLARLFLFVPLAYWLKGDNKKIFTIWCCYFLAMIIACITSPDLKQQLNMLINGERIDFGIKNAMYTSVISGVCVLISFYFILENVFLHRKLKFSLGLFTNLLIFIISGIILIGSQSRQVFVAFAMVIFFIPIFLIFSFDSFHKLRKRILSSYLIIPILIFALFQQSAIKDRFIQEKGTITYIIQGEFEKIPMDSAGLRFNSWIEAFNWIKNYPIFGIGASGPKSIIKLSEKFQENIDDPIVKGLQHFHNNHIDILVSYGIVGLILTLAPYFMIIRYLYITKKQDPNVERWLFIGLLLVTYWIVVNLFESYNLRSYGVLTQNIFMAGLLSIYFNKSGKIK